jgi:quercetin 2,3-dioxygenase
MDGRIPSYRPVARQMPGVPVSDGAGVRLNRLIGTAQLEEVDPFLLLDEFRSDDAADYIAGFPEHPHRGFETVTYMLAGRMRHGDNKGHEGRLEAGSVQWMTAGRGIVHSETPEQENGLMWGFQLWVNLPAKDKMVAPRYQEIPPAEIPIARLPGGVGAKVIAGEIAGVRGPVSGVATDPTFLDLTVPANSQASLPVPAGHSVFVYPFEGAVLVGEPGDRVEPRTLAVLGTGEAARIAAAGEPARLLLVAGRPLRETVVRYGPFVMNSPQEIRQAVSDYRHGLF